MTELTVAHSPLADLRLGRLDVRFRPQSRPLTSRSFTSAFDPNETMDAP
jgi:hypothetical protein